MKTILFITQTLCLAALGVWACLNGHKTVGGFLIFAAIISIHVNGERKDSTK